MQTKTNNKNAARDAVQYKFRVTSYRKGSFLTPQTFANTESEVEKVIAAHRAELRGCETEVVNQQTSEVVIHKPEACEDNHAELNAKAWMQSINEMLAAFNTGENDGAIEAARERIQESPLCVEVRGGWVTVGQDDSSEPVEYKILLSTGCPALRIVGDLNQWKQADNARLQYQDWGTPWTDYREASEAALIEFANHFYFGE